MMIDFFLLLLQIVTGNGVEPVISANWVLAGVTSLASFLFYLMAKTTHKDVKSEIAELKVMHKESIAKVERTLADHDDRITMNENNIYEKRIRDEYESKEFQEIQKTLKKIETKLGSI